MKQQIAREATKFRGQLEDEMSNAIPAPQFVTSEAYEGAQPQTVTKVAPLDAYLAQYKDGEGKEQVRVVFKVPGSEAVFVLSDIISGRKVASTSTGWFKDSFNQQLKLLTPVDGGEGVGSI